MAYQIYNWDKIVEEEITPLLSRKVIWGKNQTVALIHLKKGCHIAAHQHVSEQLTYILEGALKFLIDSREVTVSKGEVLHIPPNTIHEADACEDTYDLDIFSPIRDDWLRGEIDYMKSC
jgi:unsaturated pyranuronate lyase